MNQKDITRIVLSIIIILGTLTYSGLIEVPDFIGSSIGLCTWTEENIIQDLQTLEYQGTTPIYNPLTIITGDSIKEQILKAFPPSHKYIWGEQILYLFPLEQAISQSEIDSIVESSIPEGYSYELNTESGKKILHIISLDPENNPDLWAWVNQEGDKLFVTYDFNIKELYKNTYSSCEILYDASGTISDSETSEPIFGSKVNIYYSGTQDDLPGSPIITRESGRYSIGGLYTNTVYDYEVSAQGYHTRTGQIIVLSSDLVQDITLQSGGSSRECDMLGDTNDNGILDLEDVDCLDAFVFGEPLPYFCTKMICADYTQDGTISNDDRTFIIGQIEEVEETPPTSGGGGGGGSLSFGFDDSDNEGGGIIEEEKPPFKWWILLVGLALLIYVNRDTKTVKSLKLGI